MLQQYVEAGILERNDEIAACPLYHHRDVTLEWVDPLLAEAFEKHGHLMICGLRDYLFRAKQPKPVPRVLGYLND